MEVLAVEKIISPINTMDYLRDEGGNMEKALQQGVMRQLNEAKTFSTEGNIVIFHLTSEKTGGRYFLTEFIMAASPAPGPPAHIYAAESEATYVLESELLLTPAERSMKAYTGSALFVPKGTKHGLTNLGLGTARISVILTPPGLEKFWEDMSNLLKVSGAKLMPPTCSRSSKSTTWIQVENRDKFKPKIERR